MDGMDGMDTNGFLHLMDGMDRLYAVKFVHQSIDVPVHLSIQIH